MSKRTFDYYWENHRELITILNRVFMAGGEAYAPRRWWRRTWRGWSTQDEWQRTMERACTDLEAHFAEASAALINEKLGG